MRNSFSVKRVLAVVCLVSLAALLPWHDQASPAAELGRRPRARTSSPPLERASAKLAGPAAPRSLSKALVGAQLLEMPLRFERNAGQWDERVRFMASSDGVRLVLADDGATLRLGGRKKNTAPVVVATPAAEDAVASVDDDADAEVEPTHELRMRVEGARPDAQLEASETLETKTHYFFGNDPKRWYSNVPNYRQVSYRDVLPGIDLVYHGDGRTLEYDFVVAPGAEPAAIAVRYEGADSLSTNQAGELEIQIAESKLVQHRPVVYQEIEGERRLVAASFRMLGETRVGFEVGAYDRSQPLVIDPVVVFATYFAGNGADAGQDLAITSTDEIVIGGTTTSGNIGTMSAYDSTYNGTSDTFVAKLNASGTALAFVTYVGGSGTDHLWGIAIDSTNSIVATGQTRPMGASAFPTTSGAFDITANGGYDGFVYKLLPDGSGLSFSTFLGNFGTDVLHDVAIGPSDSIYVVGQTTGTNYPMTPANYHGDYPLVDAVLSKLTSSGAALTYSTYLGGADVDIGYRVAVQSNGEAVVLGSTTSSDFPLGSSPLQGTYGGATDLFVTQFSADGMSLIWSTYLGGTGAELGITLALDGLQRNAIDIAMDASGNTYIAAATMSADIPTTASVVQPTAGGNYDTFVTKISSTGAMVYSTYLGGTGEEVPLGIAADAEGRAAVTFYWSDPAPIPVQPVQALPGGLQDVVTQVLDATGQNLLFSSNFGSTGSEYGLGVKWTSTRRIATVASCAVAFPVTAGVVKATSGGGTDACVVLFSGVFMSPVATKSVVVGESVAFSATGGASFSWAFTSNGSGASQTVGSYTAGTTLGTDVLVATEPVSGDSATATITVFPVLTIARDTPAVLASGTASFTASGGIGGNVFAISTNNSGASINSGTGAYTGGTTIGLVDTVMVTDSGGHTAASNIIVADPLALSPSAPTVVPRATATFSGSGGVLPYVYSLSANPSGGSIDASSGLYTAGSTGSVTDTIVVTDDISGTTSTSVMVSAGVSFSSSTSVAYGGMQTVAATGGTGSDHTFAFVSNASGGTLDTSSGAYAPGATGGVVDVISATDPLGNTASISIAVAATPPIELSPSSATLPPRGTQTWTASGGAGLFKGYTYTISTNTSGGSIDASSGNYTAGASGGGVDVISVSDGTSNSVTALITVLPTIAISPTTASVAPWGTQTFAASDGNGVPYSFALTTNHSGGSIGANSGEYTAGAAGEVIDVVTASDSLGNTAAADVAVGSAIRVAPSSADVPPRGVQALIASGGSGQDYAYALGVNASGGSVDAGSGLYTAGSTPNVTDSVTITDSLANTGTVSLHVTAGVSVSPASASVTPLESLSFAARGGSGEDFSFELTTNRSGGAIDPDTGAYQAGVSGDVADVITASDSLGNTGIAGVSVGGGIMLRPVSSSPAPGGSQTFIATGGSGADYSYSLQIDASGGSVAASTGAYTAGRTGSVSDRLLVIDSRGNRATAEISVGPTITLTPATTTIAPLARVTFSVAGGSGHYTYAANNASGGSIDANSGAYSAGPTGGTSDVVTVTDSFGNIATATLAISAALVLTPSVLRLPPRDTRWFVATFGAGGYAFALSANGSGGSVNAVSGAYRAGTMPSTQDTLLVTDDNGATRTALISIGPGITATASSSSVPPQGSATISATGGSGTPYQYSLSNNLSGGVIDPASGAYVAGAASDVVDQVTVIDSLGNSDRFDIAVGEAIAINPPSVSLPPLASQTLVASGGSGAGYGFELTTSGSGGSVDGSSGLYRAGTTGNSSDVVTVTDSLDNTAMVTFSVGPGLSLSPPSLTLPPRASQRFTIAGGSGRGYVFSLQSSGSGSGAAISAATGAYVPGETPDSFDVVHAIDSLGNVAEVAVSIGAGIRVISATARVSPYGTLDLDAEGGSGDGYTYVLTLNSSGGRIAANTGLYVAGPAGEVEDTVTVTDSYGNSASLVIEVSALLTLEPPAPSVAPRGRVAFAANGGSGAGYHFAITDNRSDGSIDPTSGQYTAGATSDVVDVVTVIDSLGNEARVSIAVGGALSANPPVSRVPPRGSITITAGGGSGGPYAFELTTDGSGARVSEEGVYTAGSRGDSADVVTVSDELGNEAGVEISVGPALVITPARITLAPLGSMTFAVAGGGGEYQFALSANASSGTIDPSTGKYHAGAVGAVSDQVSVTDQLGNSTAATVEISAVLSLSETSLSTPPRGMITLAPQGGAPPYHYRLSTNLSRGMLHPQSGQYVAGATGSVNDVLTITDENGAMVRASVSVGRQITITAELEEVSVGQVVQLMASGGSAQGYVWAVLSQGGGSVEPATGVYTAPRAVPEEEVAIEVTDSLGNTARAVFSIEGVIVGIRGGGCTCDVTARGNLRLVPALLLLILLSTSAWRSRRRRP